MQCNYRGASNLAMEETAALKLGLAAHVDTQFAQYRLVRRRDNHAKEGIATAQLLQARKDASGRLTRGRGDRQRHKRLVGVEARVFAAQEMRLELADGLDRFIANDLELKVDARDMLKCIHDERARSAQARGSLAGHHGASA